jgi:hypothetical protein
MKLIPKQINNIYCIIIIIISKEFDIQNHAIETGCELVIDNQLPGTERYPNPILSQYKAS